MKGSTIRYARQALGLTQAKLARQIGSTQLSVTKWETDSTTPSTENMRRLKKALGLDEESIIEIESLLRDEQHNRIKFSLRKQSGAQVHD
jgi:transcriptional regulator with XRE-family HTH domain